MNKNNILKPISEEDLSKIVDFFIKYKEIYQLNPITANELSRMFPEYRETDIRKIIAKINEEDSYPIILGYEKGYKIVTDRNKVWAQIIINKRQDKNNNEINSLKILKSKVRNL